MGRKKKHKIKLRESTYSDVSRRTTNQASCKYGLKCRNKTTCLFYHEGYSKTSIPCHFGSNCTRKDCFYSHPWDPKPSPKKYDARNIIKHLLPPRKRTLKNVPDRFALFDDYFNLMAENHLADYYHVFRLALKKPPIKTTFTFGALSKYRAYVTFKVPPNLTAKISFYLIRAFGCFFIVKKGCGDNFKVTSGNSLITGFLEKKKNSKEYHETEEKGELVCYVGNFYANLISLCQLDEMAEADAKRSIKGFLCDPSSNWEGDWVKAVVPKSSGCNESQIKACNSLRKAFEVIQGPPGTGKSTTIASILRFRLDVSPSSKVLITSTRNQAIESLVEKVQPSGYSILVFGKGHKLGPLSKELLFKKKVSRMPSVVKARELYKKASAEYNKEVLEKKPKLILDQKQDELRLLGNALQDAIFCAKVELLRGAELFLATIASAKKVENEAEKCGVPLKVHTIIVDEAGCMEEISVASILTFQPRNFVFVGDHKQLPPLVFSQAEKASSDSKVDRSLMERVVDCGEEPKTLVIQYRMHRDVMAVVSKLFYGGRLSMGAIRRERKHGLIWVESDQMEEKIDEGRLFVNKEEALKCERVYLAERKQHPMQTIKIITFYVGQKRYLEKVFQRHKDPLLSIVTVDASQGSEADCVVVSCVRNNGEGQVGFLADPRRVNVAISRTREILYVVGCRRFFSEVASNANWKEIAQMAVIAQIPDASKICEVEKL